MTRHIIWDQLKMIREAKEMAEQMNLEQVQNRARLMSIPELRAAHFDCIQTAEIMGTNDMIGKDASYYMDEANIYRMELKRKEAIMARRDRRNANQAPMFDCDLAPLADAISFADRESHYAQVNLGSSAQLGKIQRLENLRYAFALVTGTAVGGMLFESKLKALIERKRK